MRFYRPLILTLLLLGLIYVFTLYLFRPEIGAGPNMLFCPHKDYELTFTKGAKLPSGDMIVIYGLHSKSGRNKPGSYLSIYSVCGPKLLYKFAPVVPAAIGYPRPLMIEKAEVLYKGEELFILTSWGETGADYFGTHPILLKYSSQGFRAVQFYKGYLSDSPRIRHFSWTTKDFEVTDQFDRSEKVFTILTQGVSVVKSNMIELSFYGDNKPHAAEHKYVLFDFPLPAVR
jgi:hypothetical protein